jgi:ketosteroid isomerase-like protein
VGVIPDLTGIYHGHDAIRGFWQRWLETWRDLRFEIEDIRDADDEVVLLIGNQRQWGRSTGIETDAPPYAWVFTFRGDRIVRAAFYPTHGEALEAAGLSE